MKLKDWFMYSDAKDALYKGGAMLLLLLSLLAILAVVMGIISLSKGASDDAMVNTITVSGDAEIFAVPDVATVSLTVTEEALVLVNAQTKVTTTMNAILEALAGKDIDEEDIQTQNYSSNPRYEYDRKTGERTLAGYEVTHTVVVKVRNLEIVGDVVALLGGYGVDNMSGPDFTIDDPEALQEEARAEAIADAKKEAKRLAAELGVRLGKLVSYNEGGYMPFMMKAEVANMSMDAGVPESMPVPELPTGEQSITANVSLTYRIK
ncbi:MAG: SIMPL domain-containing protein [Candidatus Pacebacteria bacterium]|nr:SIMPL domain-containing protein [Candidatus Paceibacterota bacterium]